MRCWRRSASEAAPFMASTANDAASGGILPLFHAVGGGRAKRGHEGLGRCGSRSPSPFSSTGSSPSSRQGSSSRRPGARRGPPAELGNDRLRRVLATGNALAPRREGLKRPWRPVPGRPRQAARHPEPPPASAQPWRRGRSEGRLTTPEHGERSKFPFRPETLRRVDRRELSSG